MPPEEKDIDVGDSEESSVNVDLDENKDEIQELSFKEGDKACSILLFILMK